ncbi:MAG: hypothetical protein ABIL09_20035 [Gemmatimonadota bacterium]
MQDLVAGWLIGAGGLYGETPEGWKRLGAGSFGVTAILRRPDGVLVGVDGGLWHIPAGTDRWVQWHDETLTSVLDLAPVPSGVGAVVASAYGVATGALDDLGAPRWTGHSDALTVNHRYSNAVLVDAADPTRWIVGTEDGVMVAEGSGAGWRTASLTGHPVRALCRAADRYWAGADDGGVCTSVNGMDWARAGQGLDDVSVFSLAWTGDRFLAGTDRGVAVGDGRGRWQLGGMPLRVAAVGAADGRWLAGASPGGLWESRDAGATWRHTGDFQWVRVVVAPEGTR